MKPIFSNHCVCTKEAFREVLIHYQLKQVKAQNIIILVSVLVFLYISLSNESSTVAFYFVLLGGFSLFFTAAHPIITADKTYNRNLELFQSELESEYDFYEDHFVSTTWPSNTVITVYYDQLKQIISTKNYFLLVIGQQMINFVDKESFANITIPEFETFLREKAPNAKFLI